MKHIPLTPVSGSSSFSPFGSMARIFLFTLLTLTFGMSGRPAMAGETVFPPVPARLTLQQAYDRALATDQSIDLAYYEFKKAELLPAQALTRLTPRLNASVGASRSGTDPTSAPWSHSNSGRARVSLSQPLLDYTVGPAYRAGLLSAAESQSSYRDIVRDTILAVANAYYNVLQEQQLVAVNQENLRLAEEQKSLASARVDIGEVLKTDVLRADVTVQRARRILVESENRLKLARTVLADALNLGPGAVFEAVEPPPWTAGEQSVEGARQLARSRRDDLQRAALAVQRRRENLAEVRGNYLPTISADAGVGRDIRDSRGSITGANDYSAGLSLNIPLYTGGRKQLDLRNAEANISQAELDYQRLAKAADEAVTAAWLQVQTLKSTLEGLRIEVTSASENHRLLREQYQEGEVKSLDVLQALTDLASSRTDLTISTYQYQLALRQLAARTATFEAARINKAAARLSSKP